MRHVSAGNCSGIMLRRRMASSDCSPFITSVTVGNGKFLVRCWCIYSRLRLVVLTWSRNAWTDKVLCGVTSSGTPTVAECPSRRHYGEGHAASVLIMLICLFGQNQQLTYFCSLPPTTYSKFHASVWYWFHAVQVVMSQCSSSNKAGFNIVHSAGRNHVTLDGLFNIVSYDLVSKLNDAISDAQFKVS